MKERERHEEIQANRQRAINDSKGFDQKKNIL